MNRYFKEVLDAHELISRWLGNAETPVEVCENLLSHFSPSYSMVTTTGALLDFNSLKSFFLTQRGARPELEIEITDMQIVAESDKGATVTYKERQQVPGQSTTLRFSTIVFEIDRNGHVIWRHLHETSLPLN